MNNNRNVGSQNNSAEQFNKATDSKGVLKPSHKESKNNLPANRYGMQIQEDNQRKEKED